MHTSSTAMIVAALALSEAIASPFEHAVHRHAKRHAEPLQIIGVDVDKRELQAWNETNVRFEVSSSGRSYDGVGAHGLSRPSTDIENDANAYHLQFATVQITYSSGHSWGQPTSALQVPAPVTTTSAGAARAATGNAPTTPSSKVSKTTSSVPASSTAAVSGGSTSTLLTPDDAIKLSILGVSSEGFNAVDASGGVWLGDDGPYTNAFTNSAREHLILVIWGPSASWVNVHKPLITVSLPAKATTSVSFSDGSIGAWSAIYSDTRLVNGQISNTWGEYTMSANGVVDVSREVNMNGHTMSIVGPSCTSDMDTCVFVCSSGTVCITDYILQACAAGSQPGAQDGIDSNGAPSGGCGGLGSSAVLKTTFS